MREPRLFYVREATFLCIIVSLYTSGNSLPFRGQRTRDHQPCAFNVPWEKRYPISTAKSNFRKHVRVLSFKNVRILTKNAWEYFYSVRKKVPTTEPVYISLRHANQLNADVILNQNQIMRKRKDFIWSSKTFFVSISEIIFSYIMLVQTF